MHWIINDARCFRFKASGGNDSPGIDMALMVMLVLIISRISILPASQANKTMRHGFRVHFLIPLPFYVNAIIIAFSFCGLFFNCFKRIKSSCIFNFLSFLNENDSYKSLIPLCWLIGFFFPCFFLLLLFQLLVCILNAFFNSFGIVCFVFFYFSYCCFPCFLTCVSLLCFFFRS